MPKLYGNKSKQVLAKGDDIDDIIPLDDIDASVCTRPETNTATTIHEGDVGEEQVGIIPIGIIDDEALTEDPDAGISTQTVDAPVPEERAARVPKHIADRDQVAETVTGTISTETLDDNPITEEAGVTEVDVVDDSLPVEKAGTIDTEINPGDICIKDS